MFGILVFWYFDCLDFWFCRGKRFFQETKSKIPNKQQTNIPKNKETKQQKTEYREIEINKQGSTLSVDRCFFGCWSRSSSGSTDTIGGLKLDLLPTLQKQTPHSRAESSQPPKSNPPFSSRRGGLLWRTFQSEAVSDTRMQPGTKKAKHQSSTEKNGTVLFLLFLFFFVFLVLCFFVCFCSLVLCFFLLLFFCVFGS